MGTLDGILEALRDAKRGKEEPGVGGIKLATITGVDANGQTLVRFDGEASASTRGYPRAGSAQAGVPGDRVIMQRAGSTWVVMDRIASTTGIDYGPMRLLARQGYNNVGPNQNPFPNNNAWINGWLPGTRIAIPAGCRTFCVSSNAEARAGSNAALFWEMGVEFEDGSVISGTGGSSNGMRFHNQSDPNKMCAFDITAWFPAGLHTAVRPYINVAVDSGGGAFSPGFANWVFSYFA